MKSDGYAEMRMLFDACRLIVGVADEVIVRKAAGDAFGKFMAHAVECRKAMAIAESKHPINLKEVS